MQSADAVEKIDIHIVEQMIAGLIGEPCMRKEVGEHKSLSLGFGSAKPATETSKPRAYRSWEFVTYRTSWRVIADKKVVCGHRDLGDNSEFDVALDAINFGRFSGLLHLNEFDVRIELDNGIVVDFLSAFSDDDESLTIFCPEERVVQFSPMHGWETGPSDKPWLRASLL